MTSNPTLDHATIAKIRTIGEVWESPRGDVVLVNADCLEILPMLEAGSVDAVVTDPPYKTKYTVNGPGMPVRGRYSCRRLAANVSGYSEDFDPSHLLDWPCVLFGADQYCDKLTTDGVFHVWDKSHSGGPQDSFSDVEIIWTSWRRSREIIRYLWKGVCQDGEKGRKKLHQSQKPEAVMIRCVNMTTAETICDPYVGSGTTAVACIRTGRKCIGIELDPKYYEIAIKRCQDEYARTALLDGVKTVEVKRQRELIPA